MFLEGKKSSNHNQITEQSIPKSEGHRPHHNRNRSRWSKKRKRSSTPTALLLHGDDSDCQENILDDDEKNDSFEGCRDSNRKASSLLPLPWTSDQHREFVNAVFEIGIEQSSPAVIAEQMITKNNYNTIYPTNSFSQNDNNNQESTPCNNKNSARSSPSPNVLPNNHNIAIATAAALANMGQNENEKKTENDPEKDDLPEVAEYYKRELTGGRLKSHLQKFRKQRVREKDVFLGDYNRFLNRREIIDREEKEAENIKEQRKEEARRRKLRRKRSQKPSSLLNASAFDHPASMGYDNEDVTKEEEERLLSMYLPLRSAVATANSIITSSRMAAHHKDFDSDFKFDEENTVPSAFSAGGKAIGMVTWAVREQEIEDRKKRKQRQLAIQQHQKDKQHQHQHQQSLTPCHNGYETASVDSSTSHTAIAAGKVASALGPGRRGPAAIDRKGMLEKGAPENRIIGCASSESDHTETEEKGDDSEDEFDQFKASVPSLTEIEMNSPLGVSLRLTWDMIKHMHGVITEGRASKIKEQELHQKQNALKQQQQQGSPQKMQHPTEGSFSKKEKLLQSSMPSKSELHRKGHLSLVSNASGKDTERILPPMTNRGRKANHQDPMSNYPIPTAAATVLDHQVWDAPTNPNLLASMAANGVPPAHLVQALCGAALEDPGKPFLLSALMGNAHSVVTPSLQTSPGTMERYTEHEQPQSPSARGPWNLPSNHKARSAFARTTIPPTAAPSAANQGKLLKPFPPPKDLFVDHQNPPTFSIPESRPHSPMDSLSTPTTPAEAMFRSLVQDNQQPKEQQNPM